MPVLAIMSPKGGAGCTTLAANLGAAMSRMGWRVTLIDLHAQNALRHLLAPDSGATDGVGRAAQDGRSWLEPSVRTRTGMVLVPFGPSLASEPPITAELLGAQLRRLCPGRTDLAILDTPAGDCAVARAADQVADVGVAVLLADAGSTAVLPDYGRGALLTPLTGSEPPRYIVLNQLDRRRRLSQDIAEFLERRLETRLLGAVRYDEALAEAAAQNLTLSEDEQAQGAASDIRDMARKLQAILA